MVLQALPVMLVLFVFFPRIQGPLWKSMENGHAAKTGLSDTMEPGSISRLGQSQRLAFRANFEGPPPPPQLRYWRGPVFWHTDGRRWTMPVERLIPPLAQRQTEGTIYRYTLTLEPYGQRWVTALDLPRQYPGELRQTAEYLLLAKEPINERKLYRLASQSNYPVDELSRYDRQRGLELPYPPSPRMRELVDGWRSHSAGPDELVRHALDYFRDGSFFYTLNPPLIEGNPVDGFLFGTRQGFCEHYAAAFTVLMRSAGVPARVVTGYQGGRWNAVGKFLEVRQADAHAWVEVWLPGTGWARVDPTAAVAPQRIEQGMELANASAAGNISFKPLVDKVQQSDADNSVKDYGMNADNAWDSLNHTWNLWILSYTPAVQSGFVKSLGLVSWRVLAGCLVAMLLVIMTITALLILPKGRLRIDLAQSLYIVFLKKMAKRGFVKQPTEGALTFARRVVPLIPEAEQDILKITEVFLNIRYGCESNAEDFDRLKRLIKALRI